MITGPALRAAPAKTNRNIEKCFMHNLLPLIGTKNFSEIVLYHLEVAIFLIYSVLLMCFELWPKRGFIKTRTHDVV